MSIELTEKNKQELIKKVIEDNITVYHVEDDGVIQEFRTYKEAKEFVSYAQNPKSYIDNWNKANDLKAWQDGTLVNTNAIDKLSDEQVNQVADILGVK
tara:strand:- start:38 stop:331 length:294 start_codon:yes stop_codon:yes gene_type:complete